MTSDPGNFTHYCPSSVHDNSRIIVGNGSTLPVLGRGSTTIHNSNHSFHLSNFLHTPNLIKNLISVRKFTKDNVCSIEFDSLGFSIKDLHIRKEILRSSSRGDLYPFHYDRPSHTPVALHISTDTNLWHQCLGHPGHQKLDRVLSIFSVPSINKSCHVCDACQKGCHVCLPFPNSSSKTYFPFQLVHCDLWTSPLPSFTRYKYYLVILDDFSRYLWTFPLRHKLDTFSTIQNFYSYVQTQFHIQIQSLQCDNGTEFNNNALRSFLTRHGTTYRLSCPYTSPQNGKVERSIHSINDVLHTLLFQAKLPPTFWVEALNTATYLINRRPSTPLQFATPYHILFDQEPDYTHLKVFGCLCYPNLSSTMPHKLSHRSTPCVFLGYPQDHKGYRCMSISTKKIIISCHVIFDESSFPFSAQKDTP
jgi:transposase InsO family protein